MNMLLAVSLSCLFAVTSSAPFVGYGDNYGYDGFSRTNKGQ